MTIRHQIHCELSPYCTLCREELPEPPYVFGRGGEEFLRTWNRKFLAIFNLSDGDRPVRALAALTDFESPEYFYELHPLGYAAELSAQLEICFDNCSRPHRLAHAVHVRCWKLVRSRVGDKNINASIYKLARSTYKLFKIPKSAGDPLERITNFEQVTSEQGLNSNVGQFLNFVSRFPVELQLRISAASTGSPLSTALVVHNSSTGLLRSMSKHSSKPSYSVVCLDPRFKYITAQWIRIYGHLYLSSLESSEVDNQDANQNRMNNRLTIRPIRGIKFSLGQYGLQALKLLYTDDTDSAWLGNESRGWIGATYAENITDLIVQRDDLKCLRIGLRTGLEVRDPVPTPKDLVMWDRDVSFSDAQTNYVYDTIDSCPSIANYAGWRLARYNPLLRGQDYVTGITVYCCHLSIQGIMTHGKSDILTGSRIGCPIYLPLRNGERLVSIWVYRPPDLTIPSMKSPTFLMLTNRGRTQVFSPVLDIPASRFLRRFWAPLDNDAISPIVSIFYDALRTTDFGDIMSFGVTKDGGNDHLKPIPANVYKPLIPRPNNIRGARHFLSVANLVDVNRLDLRRNRERCLGLRIEHSDGLVEILGQWDPVEKLQTLQIYDSAQGALKEICFCFADNYLTNIVVGFGDDVRVQEANKTMKGAFYLNDLTKHIAWWFNTAIADRVELWDGTFEELEWIRPEGRKMDFGGP